MTLGRAIEALVADPQARAWRAGWGPGVTLAFVNGALVRGGGGALVMEHWTPIPSDTEAEWEVTT